TDAVSGDLIPANSVTAIDPDGIDVPFASGGFGEVIGLGQYIIEINLGTGDYKLKFTAPGHLTTYYSGKPTEDTADLVSVTAPEFKNHIDEALEPCDPTTSTITLCATESTLPVTTSTLAVTTTTLVTGAVCGDPVALVSDSAADDTLPRSIT